MDISCQHMELTDAIDGHVRAKMEKVLRHLDQPPTSCGAALAIDRGRHVCEIKLHALQHDFFAKNEAADMYAAIDGAVDKIDRQIHDFKGKNSPRRS